MKNTMNQRIKEHGENLNAIFNTRLESVTLCKKLRRLERKAHHATNCLCNTNTLDHLNHTRPWDLEQATYEEIDLFFDKIKKSVMKILKINPVYPLSPDDSYPIFINFDPRGYALKISDEYMKERNTKLHRDFGGYGILAPDLTKG